jgi:hypothetical protein
MSQKMSLVRRKKKQNRNETIKAFKDKLDGLLEEYKLDIETFPKLEDLQKLFHTMVKTLETVKKTRNNSNTGLGKSRLLTPEARNFIMTYKDEDKIIASRSYLTSLISKYIKEKNLQSTKEKMYFECDALLCHLFNSAYITHESLDKYLGLRCMQQRFPDGVVTYIRDAERNECLSTESLQLVENDLISWRELQTILYLTYQKGSYKEDCKDGLDQEICHRY